MIIGYTFSQKCNENAKLNWVIMPNFDELLADEFTKYGNFI